MTIYFKSGYDHVTTRRYELQTGITPPVPITHRLYSLSALGLLAIEERFSWDGATWCPEWLVPQEASAPHDALTQMTAAGLLDYETCSPLVHGLLRDMVIQRWEPKVGKYAAKAIGWGVFKAVTKAKGGHPSHLHDNPELMDPLEE